MNILAKVVGLLTTIGLTAGATITWAHTSADGQVIVTVCPQGPPACQFSRIREAINAAVDGATILISPGTYTEQGELKISKNVNLLGPEPRLVRLITGRVSIEGPIQVMINGLAIHGLATYGTMKVYEAKVALANVDIIGGINVNVIETETEQPQHSQLTLTNVYVLGNVTLAALLIGPAAEVIVHQSKFVSSDDDGVLVMENSQLIMSHSLIRILGYWGDGLVVAGGAKVWLSDTQIDISTLLIQADERKGPVGIADYGGDLVLQRIAIFSTNHGILIGNTARLHMEASQVVAIRGWGVSLVIEPCGVRFPPTADPSPQTFEGLITGRQNEITSLSDRGDVCPSALEFLKTAEGGQYP